MMGRIHTAASFRQTISYCLLDKKLANGHVIFKDRAEILAFNRCFGNRESLIRQYNDVAEQHLNMSRPVLHISLSLPPRERLSKSFLVQLAQDCAVHFGFDQHQYLTVLHKDTPQQHIHIVANRIGFDGHTVDDSFSIGKIADYCRKAEKQHHLTPELGPRRYLSKTLRNLLPRHGTRLDRLHDDIDYALRQSSSYADFCRRMQDLGYTVYDKRGIAFMDKKNVLIRGYEAGYSRKTIDLCIEEKVQLRQIQERKQVHEQKLIQRAPTPELKPELKPELTKTPQPKQKLQHDITHYL